MDSEQVKQHRVLLSLLLFFYLVFLISAILLQVRSGEPPSTSGAAIDKFTGSLFWVISIMSLFFAALHVDSKSRLFLWLLISAGAGALAIDEIFEFHEKTRNIVGDDDYIKMLSLLIAAVGSYILYCVERPTKGVVIAFVTGLLFHSLYILVDIGDGDIFSLPFSRNTLIWAEEIFETLSLQAYLAGFLLHLISNARSIDQRTAFDR